MKGRFSDKDRDDAMRRADRMCVACRVEVAVHVHHIEPAAEGGSDDITNAAPLCTKCHDLYQGNKEKRNALTQLRDTWWARCEAPRETNFLLRGIWAEMLRARGRYEMGDASALSPFRSCASTFAAAATTQFINENEPGDTMNLISTIAQATDAGMPIFAGTDKPRCPRCGKPMDSFMIDSNGLQVCETCYRKG